MAAWLVVLLTVAMAAADQQMSIIEMDYSYWGGPEAGCRSEEGAGQMILSCTLPSGNMTVYVDRSAVSLKIICEKNSTLVCEELQEAKRHIDSYVATDGQTNRRLSSLHIETCALSQESLACPIGVLGASGTSLVRLERVEGELLPVHLEGLEGVTKFRMYDVDALTTEVPYEALANLPTLRSFTMKGASLVLDVGAAEVLPDLVTLELAAGGLETLPKAAFQNTPRAQTLLLWSNKIDLVDVDAFEGLNNLVNLSLNGNRISHLPGGLFRHTPRLEKVDLYANQLVELTQDLFSGLQRLKEILIFDNRAPLRLANGTFSNLPSLHNLKLDRCAIESLPADLFANTTSLKTLSLKGNLLKLLPNAVFLELKLVNLNLANNVLDHLAGGQFQGQEALLELELQRNNLSSLPAGLFADMKSLRVLNMGHNYIERLNRSTFKGLNSLKELYLTKNKLVSLDYAVFEFTPNLEVISLARNNLTISHERNTLVLLPYPAFGLSDEDAPPQMRTYDSPLRHLVALTRVDLSHNGVAVVCDDWTRMINLVELDLSYNNITSLTDVDMHFSSNLTVDLRHNNITHFRPNINSPATTAPRFLMDHNPYTCDCHLYPLVSAIRTGSATNIELSGAACDRPENLRGVRLESLRPEQMVCDVDCQAGSTRNTTTCHRCTLRPDISRLDMICDSIPDAYPELPPGIDSAYVKLRHPSDIPALPADVKIVDLSNLNLTVAPRAASIELNLTDNGLVVAPVELLRGNCTLHLRGNPFDCSCENRDSLETLNAYRHRIVDFVSLTCSDGTPVALAAPARLCAARDAAVVGASLAALGLLAAALTALAFRHPTELRILLRRLGLWCGAEPSAEAYDAFVSFAHEDEAFVAEQLLPRLERGRPPLRLCVHYRDWLAGDWIPAQIARSVRESRRTVVVLSRHFVRSAWGRMEFREAHSRDRVVVLLLEDVAADGDLDPELRSYISTKTYLRADDPLLWDRLRDAILRRRWGGRLTKTKPAAGLDVRLDSGVLVNGPAAPSA